MLASAHPPAIKSEGCESLVQLQAVFIIALGRTGSSNLVRVLNTIPGYRISGETDNAWLHLARWARQRRDTAEALWLKQQKQRETRADGSSTSLQEDIRSEYEQALYGSEKYIPVCQMWPPFQRRAAARVANFSKLCYSGRSGRRVRRSKACRSAVYGQSRNLALTYRMPRLTGCSARDRQADEAARAAQRCHQSVTKTLCREEPAVALDCPLACGTCRDAFKRPFQEERVLCDARRLLLTVHNPRPRARVFGFKEIYSPWIRDVDHLDEVIDGGVGFLRSLFPRAKFIFHWRENMTRVAGSDFWQKEAHRDDSVGRFTRVAQHYLRYAQTYPDHAFVSTLEGTTMTKKEHDFWRLEQDWENITVPKFKRSVWRYQALLTEQPQRAIKNAVLCPEMPQLKHEFWKLENDSNVSVRDFRRTVLSYQRCMGSAGLTDRRLQLDRLFEFLGEPLTPEVHTAAREDPQLHDWKEETHTRRFARRLPNGTVVYETKQYAYLSSDQFRRSAESA